MKRLKQHMALVVAVIFSFTLVYQSLHQLKHLVPKSHCCHHHECAQMVPDGEQNQGELILSVPEEHCPVCEYEHTAYNLPERQLVIHVGFVDFGVLADGYQAPDFTSYLNHFSQRGPPLS